MKKNILKTMFIFLSSVYLFSCGNKASSKDILIYGSSSDPVTFDPTLATEGSSLNLLTSVCEALVGYNVNNPSQIVPKLSKDWTISKDGKKYIFNLREGIVFFDGTPMNADAVVFSYLRQKNKNNPYFVQSPYWNSFGFAKNLADVKKISNTRIEIDLNYSDATFLSKLAFMSMVVVSPKAIKTMKPEEFAKHPICTGPFKIGSWKKGQQVVLERNEKYWNKELFPKVKKVVVRTIKDNSARILALKKGEIDIDDLVVVEDIDKIKEDKNLSLVVMGGFSQRYLWFNVEYPPLNNVKVRRAIAHLINKPALVKRVTMGYGSVAVNQIPKVMWGYDKTIKDYDYNVKKAKKMLAEAGYPNGFEIKIYNYGSADDKLTSEILQDYLSKAGIKLSIQSLELGSFSEITKERKYKGIAISNWGADYIDPDNFFSTQFTARAAIKPGINIGGWVNSQFDSYITEASRITNRIARTELYKKAQQIMHKDVPVITLYDRSSLMGVRKGIKGFDQIAHLVPIFAKVEKE